MITKDVNIIHIVTNADVIFHKLRWSDQDPICPYCGEKHIYHYKNGTYRCSHCRKTFSDTSNTIFHKTHLKKADWLIALYLMMDTKGISSVDLSKILGISQRSSWLCLTKLRYMFDQSDSILQGSEIAIDEVYLGQNSSTMQLCKRQALISKYNLPTKPKNKEEKQAILNAINQREKQPVFGLNDGTNICLLALSNPYNSNIIVEEYLAHTRADYLVPMTVSDCGLIYKDWEQKTGWSHSTNNHSKGQYKTAEGLSSNRIEGNFRWLEGKRSYMYVHYSKRLTQLYLNEFAYRHNYRQYSAMEKLERSFKLIFCRFNTSDIREYDPYKRFIGKAPIYKDYSYIKDVLKTGIVEEIRDGGLVWRAADYR